MKIGVLTDVAKLENIGEVNDWPKLTSICIGSAMEEYHSSSGLINCPSRRGSSALRESADLPNWGADFLREGVYELRASYQGVHYRILYFFAGKSVVVLSHGLTKEREVPNKEIERAIERKKQVEAELERYTFQPSYEGEAA